MENIEELIQKELDDFFTLENSKVWWNLPNTELNHRTPRQMVDDGDGQIVLDLLRNFTR